WPSLSGCAPVFYFGFSRPSPQDASLLSLLTHYPWSMVRRIHIHDRCYQLERQYHRIPIIILAKFTDAKHLISSGLSSSRCFPSLLNKIVSQYFPVSFAAFVD